MCRTAVADSYAPRARAAPIVQTAAAVAAPAVLAAEGAAATASGAVSRAREAVVGTKDLVVEKVRACLLRLRHGGLREALRFRTFFYVVQLR